MKNLILFLLLYMLSISCTPVRSTVDVGSKSKNNQNQKENQKTEEKIVKKQNRFQDTITIEIPPVKPPINFHKNGEEEIQSGEEIKKSQENELDTTISTINNSSINDEFEEAVKLFENKKFDEACKKFTFFDATLEENDSLAFETKYYIAECNITKNNFPPAINILDSLYKNKNTPDKILEKIIVRLGQIQCAQKKYSIADKFFKELKTRYPKSVYLEVANCNFIKKK